MTPVFADTLYWYGLANRRDQWHHRVLQAKADSAGRPVITTEEVLTEFLAAMPGDPFLRRAARILVEALFQDASITVLPQSHDSFLKGFRLYNARPDKAYSLTDCISMEVCKQQGIMEILTSDHHFAQEGLTLLIP